MSTTRWRHNPVTGELGRIRVAPEETGGRRMEGDLWLQPGAAVMGEHTHSALTEAFAVEEGSIGYRLDGREGVAGPGETIHIPIGARHDWWNAGPGRAFARFTLESADPAVPMAGRFLSMLEVAWGLAARGATNAKGMPGPLWLAVVAREYRDVLAFTTPPAVVQALVLAPLAAVGRATGHDALAPALHDGGGPSAIPEPDEETLEALLSGQAPTAALLVASGRA
jgi:quercetin dioxygenase-like cupin family protein